MRPPTGNQRLDRAWFYRQTDTVSPPSSCAFIRIGRLFTEPMVETAGGRFRTGHRNTRNVLKARQSFLDQGEMKSAFGRPTSAVW